jgi:hypothetical protein
MLYKLFGLCFLEVFTTRTVRSNDYQIDVEMVCHQVGKDNYGNEIHVAFATIGDVTKITRMTIILEADRQNPLSFGHGYFGRPFGISKDGNTGFILDMSVKRRQAIATVRERLQAHRVTMFFFWGP